LAFVGSPNQPTPGGELPVTGERQRPDIELALDGRDQVLMIHNFLARLGISSGARVERREVDLYQGKTYLLFTVSEDVDVFRIRCRRGAPGH
jgi:hypothetical protein